MYGVNLAIKRLILSLLLFSFTPEEIFIAVTVLLQKENPPFTSLCLEASFYIRLNTKKEEKLLTERGILFLSLSLTLPLA